MLFEVNIASTHELLLVSLTTIDVPFLFLFESLYFFLTLYHRATPLTASLSSHLPTPSSLLTWLDSLTEASFLSQASSS